MNDIFGKVVSILLCAWLMFFYPLNAAKEENHQLERMYIYQETVRFVDNICNTGIISDRDMKNYLDKISRMNTLYETSITHESLIDNTEEETAGTEAGKSFINHYQNEIFDILEQEEEYRLGYSDFIKIVVYNSEGNMSVCYGGSIKAADLHREENR